MLSRKYRLTKRKQFNYIYKRGKGQTCDVMSLVFCAGKYKTIKVGFSASKKVGNSVVRHRALRLMREAVKPHLDKMALNHSYIFIAKEGIEKKHLSELTRAMEHLLKRASLIKN